MKIILASASPRRQELLRQLGVEFDLHPVAIDERPREGESPSEYVLRLAREKAVAAFKAHHRPTLGADTVVVVEGEILGKPGLPDEARAMLKKLSGKTHEVYSGVALVTEDKTLATFSRTLVTFKRLLEEEIEAYLATGEPFDKAGAYAIQGKGAVFVRSIEGSYSGVVGLPLFETAQLFRKIGFRLP